SFTVSALSSISRVEPTPWGSGLVQRHETKSLNQSAMRSPSVKSSKTRSAGAPITASFSKRCFDRSVKSSSVGSRGNHTMGLLAMGSGCEQDPSKVADVVVIVQPRDRCTHLGERRIDETEESGVVLHSVDEDEPPGILELPLHGHEVELADEAAVLLPR